MCIVPTYLCRRFQKEGANEHLDESSAKITSLIIVRCFVLLQNGEKPNFILNCHFFSLQMKYDFEVWNFF